MATATKVTPEEFAAMGDAARGYNLVGGILEAIPMSKLAAAVASELHGHVWGFVRLHKLGSAFAEGTAYRCFPNDPNRIRKADVSFIAAGRIAAADLNSDFAFEIVPDFVCEVISPTDTYKSIRTKRGEWLEAGVKLYWQIDPEDRIVRAYTRAPDYIELKVGETLAAGPVIPGFCLPVADLFPQA